MSELTPQEIAEKQIRNAANAVNDFKKGVMASKKNPMQLAIAQKEKMRKNVMQALDDGTWEDGLNSVNLQEYKQTTAEKGGSRYAEGVKAAKNKIIEFQTQFAPVRKQVSEQVQTMPSTTFEERMQRMVANATMLHQFRYKRRRGNS